MFKDAAPYYKFLHDLSDRLNSKSFKAKEINLVKVAEKLCVYVRPPKNVSFDDFFKAQNWWKAPKSQCL